jgi:hypothetical protein
MPRGKHVSIEIWKRSIISKARTNLSPSRGYLMAGRSKTNLHSNGGTGFQPVHAQAEACGYQKLPYGFSFV